MFACLYRPPQSNRFESIRQVAFGELVDGASREALLAEVNDLVAIAHSCSPRYELHGPNLVVIDVAGLERLFGPSYVIADELRRAAAERHLRVHIAVAATQTAATILARARPGVTVVQAGGEAAALAPIAIGILDAWRQEPDDTLQTLQRWGVKTLGELAALPAADLASRLGRPALVWHDRARGVDRRPLIPSLEEERFESTLALEWPIEGLEPLSFVLTRLLEPLAVQLERRDRGAAVLHVVLGLVTRDIHARRLELPTPMREVRALRTLVLLDLESHPPAAAIDRVTIVIDPTPGRVVQHTLFSRPHPTPEQLATLLARLVAVMGQDRIGAPSTVDTFRPGAFTMQPFQTEHTGAGGAGEAGRAGGAGGAGETPSPGETLPPFQPVPPVPPVVQAVRRCRQPVPARVAVADGRPVRVTSDRRGFTGGAVVRAAGPWRTSGGWWDTKWSREEWDVALSDGSVYRVFLDSETDGWFIDAIVD